MSRIIAVAENYAFGPISKLLTVCGKLLEQGHEVVFVGEGTAYQLGSRMDFTDIYQLDTDSPSFPEQATHLFKHADALLSSVDRSSVILAKSVGLRVIWLDMLFYWWDEIPEYLWDVDLYIQQNSFKNERNTARYSDKIANMVVVGPILDLSYKSGRTKNQLLVAFGGTEAAGWYQIGRDSNYPYTISRLILESVDTSAYETVLFAGNERIMNDLNRRYGNHRVRFTILPHDVWLRELAESRDVLINPGLEGPLEAIAYEKPIFFLPPYNSSAYVELDEFRAAGLATLENSVHFSDYYPHRSFAGRNLRTIMAEFLDELREFESSPSLLSACADRINAFLRLPQDTKDKQTARQRDYMARLGPNGLVETVAHVNRLLSQIQ